MRYINLYDHPEILHERNKNKMQFNLEFFKNTHKIKKLLSFYHQKKKKNYFSLNCPFCALKEVVSVYKYIRIT